MLVSDICGDFLLETYFVGKGRSGNDSSDNSEKFYGLGSAERVENYYDAIAGEYKSGWAFRCPRCNGTGKTKDGACNANRVNDYCSNGYMRDKVSKQVVYPENPTVEKGSKAKADEFISVDALKDEYPTEYGTYLKLVSKNEAGKLRDSDKKYFPAVQAGIESGKVNTKYIQFLRNVHKEDSKRFDPNAKYNNAKINKGEGKNVDRRTNPNDYRKTSINPR